VIEKGTGKQLENARATVLAHRAVEGGQCVDSTASTARYKDYMLPGRHADALRMHPGKTFIGSAPPREERTMMYCSGPRCSCQRRHVPRAAVPTSDESAYGLTVPTKLPTTSSRGAARIRVTPDDVHALQSVHAHGHGGADGRGYITRQTFEGPGDYVEAVEMMGRCRRTCPTFARRGMRTRKFHQAGAGCRLFEATERREEAPWLPEVR